MPANIKLSFTFMAVACAASSFGSSAAEIVTDSNGASCKPLREGFLGSAGSDACAKSEYMGLPGSKASARIPQGWVCDVGGVSNMEDEYLSVLSCIPSDGGSPVSLQKIHAARIPVSLDQYFEQSMAGYKEGPATDFYLEPRKMDIAGRMAVEVASQSDVIFDYVGGGGDTGKMVHHAIILQDGPAFYQCELTTTPSQYTAELRQIHKEFCSSIKFAETENPSGIS